MQCDRKRFLFFLWCVLIGIAGCATTEEYGEFPDAPRQQSGLYHTVGKGETLWRIAQAYGVSVQEVVARNNIPDVAHIEEGQLILIPGATTHHEVDSTYAQTEFIWPTEGEVISYFGHTNTIGMVNNGVDIRTQLGQLVHSSRDGRVVFADHLAGYDQTVILDHNDGYLTVYANNAETLVNVDDFVTKGQPLARAGSANGLSFIHFEIRKNDRANNPLYYLP